MYIQFKRFSTVRFASFAMALGLLSGLGATAQTNSTIYYSKGSPAAACADGVASTNTADRQLLSLCRTALETSSLSRADRAATLVNLGTLEARADLTDRALARFEEARRTDPGLPDIRINIAAAQIRAGDHDAALQTLSSPDTVPLSQRHIAHFNRGLAFWHLGQVQESYEAFAEAERLKPGYGPALRMLDNFTVTPESAETAPEAAPANG